MLRTKVDTILILKTADKEIDVGLVASVPEVNDEIEIGGEYAHVAARLWKYTPGAGTITCVCTVQR